MGQRKILLLENVATQAADLREHLSQAGFHVAVSRYEADGLKRLVEWGPDVVLLSTAHPAGDFTAYCRQVRTLTPSVRIIVTSSISRERLFQEHPGLPSSIDGVLPRPCRYEEVITALAPPAASPQPAPAGAAADPEIARLRVKFQREIDARFLEIEELKRHLDVATRRAASAPGLEWLQSENERLRQGVEEAQKQASLALATEQLKRSEIEVKFDNLLRMKEDFEFSVKSEAETRTRENEMLHRQVEELRARLVELDAELARQRALVAEGQIAFADVSAKAAVLEESLAGEQRACEEREQLKAQARDLREQLAVSQRQTAELQAGLNGVQDRLAAAESAAAAASGFAGQRAVENVELRSRAEALEAMVLEQRSLQSLAAERARSDEEERRALAERQELAERTGAERVLEIAALREELAAERAGRADEQRQAISEREQQAEQALREQAERDAQVATLREELAAAEEVRRREAGERETREREFRHQEQMHQAVVQAFEERLAAPAFTQSGTAAVSAELRRIQELLEEVITRARTEAVDFARRDADLSARLQAALEERRLLQERFDRAGAEASERERRSSSLLQSAIDRGSPGLPERVNLPAIVPPEPARAPVPPRRGLVLAGIVAGSLVLLFAAYRQWSFAPQAVREQKLAGQQSSPLSSPTPAVAGPALAPRKVWDRWTRSDVSGGVLVQATLRSEQELRAEVEVDRAPGLSDDGGRADLQRRLGSFRFDETRYVHVYLKNLSPGYPAYLDNLPAHFRLRDGSGKEVPAFVPPGHENDHRIFTFSTGTLGEKIYEASVSLGFDRAGLSPAPGYLQLVVSDVGATSRRVLTWELE